MKQRNPAAVFFLSLITLGLYSLIWQVKTKNEMNQLGATIPTAWLLIIPFVSIYWLWKYGEGVEKVSGGQTSGALTFVLILLLGFIGMTILQSDFNKLGGTAPVSGALASSPEQPSFQPPAQTASQPVVPSIQPVQPTLSPVDSGFSGGAVVSPDSQPVVPPPYTPPAPASPSPVEPPTVPPAPLV